MKTINLKDGPIYQLLMRIAFKMKGSGLIGLKAESDEYEIIVTIKPRRNQNEIS